MSSQEVETFPLTHLRQFKKKNSMKSKTEETKNLLWHYAMPIG